VITVSEPREWVSQLTIPLDVLRNDSSVVDLLARDMRLRAEFAFAPRLCRLLDVATMGVVIDDIYGEVSAEIVNEEPTAYAYRFRYIVIDDAP